MNTQPEQPQFQQINLLSFNEEDIDPFKKLLTQRLLTFCHTEQGDLVVLDINYYRQDQKGDEMQVSKNKYELAKFLGMAGLLPTRTTSKIADKVTMVTESLNVKIKYYKFEDLFEVLKLLKVESRHAVDFNGPQYKPTPKESTNGLDDEQ